MLAEHCEFTNRDEAIRDRFVSGLKDQDLAQKLEMLYMLKNTLTLQDLVDYAKTHEEIRGAHKAVDRVQKVKQRPAQPLPENQASASKGVPIWKGKATYGGRDCSFCGYVHAARKCPAYGKNVPSAVKLATSRRNVLTGTRSTR